MGILGANTIRAILDEEGPAKQAVLISSPRGCSEVGDTSDVLGHVGGFVSGMLLTLCMKPGMDRRVRVVSAVPLGLATGGSVALLHWLGRHVDTAEALSNMDTVCPQLLSWLHHGAEALPNWRHQMTGTGASAEPFLQADAPSAPQGQRWCLSFSAIRRTPRCSVGVRIQMSHAIPISCQLLSSNGQQLDSADELPCRVLVTDLGPLRKRRSITEISKTEERGITLAQLQELMAFLEAEAEAADGEEDGRNPIHSDPRSTSFFRAMSLCEGLLLILDHKATPFQRIWCCFEQSVALTSTHVPLSSFGHLFEVTKMDLQEKARTIYRNTHGYEDSVKAHREAQFPISLILQALTLINVKKARASQALDKVRILNSICHQPLDAEPLDSSPFYDEVDRGLRSIFALAALPACAKGGQARRAELELIAERLTDASLRSIAFPPGLELLRVDLDNISSIGDEALISISRAMPGSLTSLTLNFMGSSQPCASCSWTYVALSSPSRVCCEWPRVLSAQRSRSWIGTFPRVTCTSTWTPSLHSKPGWTHGTRPHRRKHLVLWRARPARRF
eukprot:g16949.t1